MKTKAKKILGLLLAFLGFGVFTSTFLTACYGCPTGEMDDIYRTSTKVKFTNEAFEAVDCSIAVYSYYDYASDTLTEKLCSVDTSDYTKSDFYADCSKDEYTNLSQIKHVTDAETEEYECLDCYNTTDMVLYVFYNGNIYRETIICGGYDLTIQLKAEDIVTE